MIDLRSDTVTQPTMAMRKAMAEAEVGDDVYGDDPTVLQLEHYAAEITGKEAALFVPSGTFGNQLALFTHCVRGQEVILGDDCHIVMHEVGASSVIAGVQLRTVESKEGILDPDKIEKKIRPKDIHFPETGLICLENAHSNGKVIPLSVMERVWNIAKAHQIPVHLDGARVFNASEALTVDPREITQYCDSVMFCLSKGLCAPIGSILAGDSDFIEKARKKRKLMGGGLRQVGILAAAGLIALKDMRSRLAEDHANAKFLGKALSLLSEIEVDLEGIEINMVFFRIKKQLDPADLVKTYYEHGIKINGPEDGLFRLVTNHHVQAGDLDLVVEVLKNYLQKL